MNETKALTELEQEQFEAKLAHNKAVWEAAKAFTLVLLQAHEANGAYRISMRNAVGTPLAVVAIRPLNRYEFAVGTHGKVALTENISDAGTTLEQRLTLTETHRVMITPKGDCADIEYMRNILGIYKAQQTGLPAELKQAESALEEIAMDVAAYNADRMTKEEAVAKVKHHETLVRDAWEGILAYLGKKTPVLAEAIRGVGNCAHGLAMGNQSGYGSGSYSVTDGPVSIEELGQKVAVYRLKQPAFERMKAAVEQVGVRK